MTPEHSPAEIRAEGEQRRRVMLTDDGPVLLSGPVELILPDGRKVASRRPVTALCTCRRSHHYPICDTSHRTKVRTRETDRPC